MVPLLHQGLDQIKMMLIRLHRIKASGIGKIQMLKQNESLANSPEPQDLAGRKNSSM